MRHVSLIGIAVLALAGGCAPLEQAPLVYSSTKQFGVGVKSGAPDAPGVDLNIGFRAVDAAYVPVAVAKPCPQVGTCSTAGHDIMPITGVNEVRGQSRVDRSRIEALNKIIEEGTRAIDAAAVRKTVINERIKEIATLDSLRSRVAVLAGAATEDPPRTLTASEESELVNKRSEIARISAYDAKALGDELGKIDRDNANTGAQIAKARDELTPLLAQQEIETGNNKVDALSVYGTFDGDATGEGQKASLKLGNTFSTGVAAQNVTQGVQASALTRATKECLEVTKVILADAKIPDTEKPSLIRAIASACGSKVAP